MLFERSCTDIEKLIKRVNYKTIARDTLDEITNIIYH